MINTYYLNFSEFFKYKLLVTVNYCLQSHPLAQCKLA